MKWAIAGAVVFWIGCAFIGVASMIASPGGVDAFDVLVGAGLLLMLAVMIGGLVALAKAELMTITRAEVFDRLQERGVLREWTRMPSGKFEIVTADGRSYLIDRRELPGFVLGVRLASMIAEVDRQRRSPFRRFWRWVRRSA